MQKLLPKIGYVILLAGVALLVIGLRFRNGYIDPFYLRFASPKASSLILGTSRAAQGIQPQVLNKQFSYSDLVEPPIFNFSFTIGHSPYGPAYLKLIKQKLATNTRNGLFLVTVDPWALSEKKPIIKKSEFPEDDIFTANMHTVSGYINFQYILNYYPLPYYAAFTPQDTFMLLHKNGWLEVSPPSTSEKYVSNRIRADVSNSRGHHLINDTLSYRRIHYLKQTIQFLKQHGKVILVRIPVPKEMYVLEQEFAPQFDSLITDIALKNQINYLNYPEKPEMYQFNDGHHLYKMSGHRFSEILAKDVLKLLKK